MLGIVCLEQVYFSFYIILASLILSCFLICFGFDDVLFLKLGFKMVVDF